MEKKKKTILVRTVTAAIQKLPHYIMTNHSPMSAIRSLLKNIMDGEVYKEVHHY